MGNKFYLTTAIDFSNGEPHVGHALEKVGADCIARYRRLRGDEVHYLMGMDEHAQSVIQAAARAGVSPRAWVDRMATTFADYWRRLECSNDDWIRTTEPRHVRSVTALLERIRERRPDDVFLAEYSGLYCTGCEEFKQDSQIADGHCIEHPTLDLVPTTERNHFFRLSAYRDPVLERIRAGTLRVEPAIRRNEVVRLLEDGLQDISISRLRQPWGIPFPGDPEQTVYVWFDALINYLSATGFPEEGHRRLWPADLHIVGKGITRFHCIIWPAMLLAAGVELPRMIWAHGYVQWEGAKLSKTAGTAVSLDTAINRHGPDALRYFLLREIGFENDGNFTWDRFDARYTSELADGYGNLASRILAMIGRYVGGRVPTSNERSPLDEEAELRIKGYRGFMDEQRLHEGAQETWNLIARANQYVEETAPWNLAKTKDTARLDAVLSSLARTLARITLLIQPFIPGKAQVVWHSLGLETTAAAARWPDLEKPQTGGKSVTRLTPLFPKPGTNIVSS
ncbi:MAG: methionine--tRNA ligase [Gemmatimonadetes bacterium]|nr:methionine--tRNA ligase [Gemmatimonadota bacterium]